MKDLNTYVLQHHIIHVSHCQQTLRMLSLKISQLFQKEETLLQLIDHKQRRQKRGIFNGGGYLLNWLFGTPGADDAARYDEAIRHFEEDDKNLQTLMKEQIQVITSTIHNFNDTISNLKINEEKFNENIQKLNAFMENVVDKDRTLENSIMILDNLNFLTYLANELEEQLDLLMDAVILTKTNVVHPCIITPKNLINVLNQNSKLLKNGKNFPIPLRNNFAYKLLEISTLKAFYDNGRLVFVIMIPVCNEEVYNLYKVIPLPIFQNNSQYVYIEPTFPYIAMSRNKQTYVQFTILDTICKKLSEEDYLCKNQLVYSTTDKPLCETMLLTAVNKVLPKTCKYTNIRRTVEIWHPLKSNSWIFVSSTPQRLIIDCPLSEITDKIIEHTGILTLDEDCRAYSRFAQLSAENVNSIEYLNIIPEFNILEDDCCSRSLSNNSKAYLHLSPIHLTNIKLDELNHAAHRLNLVDEHVNKMFEKHEILQHGNYFIIALKVIGFIIACAVLHKIFSYFGLYTLIKYCCSRSGERNPSNGCLVTIYNQCFRSRRETPTVPQHEMTLYTPCVPNVVEHHGRSRPIRISSRRSLHSSHADINTGFSTED